MKCTAFLSERVMHYPDATQYLTLFKGIKRAETSGFSMAGKSL